MRKTFRRSKNNEIIKLRFLGTEVVSAKVCSGGTKENCCSWESEVEIKKCGDSFVYKLKKIDNCPMAYCIGEDHNIPECEDGSVLLKKKRICLGKLFLGSSSYATIYNS